MTWEFEVGNHVTVWTSDSDSAEIAAHPHAVITEVVDHPDGARYYVGHVDAPRRFGPYSVAQLLPGWVASR